MRKQKRFSINLQQCLVAFSLTIGLLYFCSCCHSKKAKIESSVMWYEKLPPCPCENPDKNGVKLNDGWAKDKGDLHTYHRGAAESFRSYPAIETSEGESGQQCCYDSLGRLITGGSGAGTPDKVSTCDGEDANGVMNTRLMSILGHYTKDVKPWKDLGGANSGWIKYNQLWKPNNGLSCKENIVYKQ